MADPHPDPGGPGDRATGVGPGAWVVGGRGSAHLVLPQSLPDNCRGSGAVVSPVDGLVDTLVITDGAPEISGDVLRIGIFLSVLNVHATRAPITGIIRTTAALPGRHRSALSRDVGASNQRNDVWMADATNRSLFLRQIAGAIARRVVFAPNSGDTVRRGAVVGMIRFGSRVELWLPVRDGYVATVWRGDRVRGGVSVVARVHPG